MAQKNRPSPNTNDRLWVVGAVAVAVQGNHFLHQGLITLSEWSLLALGDCIFFFALASKTAGNLLVDVREGNVGHKSVNIGARFECTARSTNLKQLSDGFKCK